MRLLFERHAGERGYTDEEVTAAIIQVGGDSVGLLLDRVVRGREELDYASVLAYLGLRFRNPKEGLPPDVPPTWLGIETKPSNGRLLVTVVRTDGPAREGGLNVDDEILALAGNRITKETFTPALARHEPGERVELLVARRDAIRIVPVTLAEHPGLPWRLEIDPAASPEAVQARTAWLAPAAAPSPTQKR
jgi:predicted metalloprotease with PDZ domain